MGRWRKVLMKRANLLLPLVLLFSLIFSFIFTFQYNVCIGYNKRASLSICSGLVS